MKIVLSGVETNNKGAELMLYAILQEIEKKYPEADVYISKSSVPQGLRYIKTTLKMHYFPIEWFVNATHINSILNKMRLPEIALMNYVNADYFLDGSGFAFSDQCKLWGTSPQWWERILKHQNRTGAKIIFLPQAFGPFEMEMTQRAISILSQYSSVIMAREKVSYDYLKNSGKVDMRKVKIYPDFTSLVEGKFPSELETLRNGICIIPNIRMIKNGLISLDDYIHQLTLFATEGKKSGHPVYLLNHEGQDDAELCLLCKERIGSDVEAVTNLNGLETKGIISSAYMVITSRFHGLASSLNSGVPSLATSWSHKYKELFKNYGLDGFVLPLNDMEVAVKKVRSLINENENKRIREFLMNEVPKINDQTRKMWEVVWSL